MRLNACATADTSSPPVADARAVRSPSPKRRAASSSARSRACAGRNTSSAASAVPPSSSSAAPGREPRPQLAGTAPDADHRRHEDHAPPARRRHEPARPPGAAGRTSAARPGGRPARTCAGRRLGRRSRAGSPGADGRSGPAARPNGPRRRRRSSARGASRPCAQQSRRHLDARRADHRAVGEHHERRAAGSLRTARWRLLRDRCAGSALQRGLELRRDQRREVLPDRSGWPCSVCTAIQTNDAACATSITASKTMKPAAMRQ